MVLALGIVTSAFLPRLDPILAPAAAAAPDDISFPDTQNYWGQPFIQALAERNIVKGYLDNTYRPEQAVNRDEFAAIVRQAFSQDPERQISSGSVYKDIPKGYWASPAIQEAYEMGFMTGYPGGEFRPNQPVTKVEVLVSLAQNLELPTAKTEDTGSQVAPTTPVTTSQQPVSRRRVKRPLMFPIAMTALMQPLIAIRAQAAAPANVPPTDQPAASTTPSQRPVSLIVSDYYQDAAQIPQYAVDDVARTTEAGIVVNHPDPRTLNPDQPASRGEVAALIHQALVHQGKISSLPADETATNYIVGR
ncbi:S-layer homology domain-containing protein [Phormidium tenue FACHB-886]|nr:S-layer homology domain-containing protein [Phormidium tenue FACHB-886]